MYLKLKSMQLIFNSQCFHFSVNKSFTINLNKYNMYGIEVYNEITIGIDSHSSFYLIYLV